MTSPGDWCPVHRQDVEMHLMPDGSALLYDPVRNAGYGLSALGALVWDMCDGTFTAAALLTELETELEQVQNIRRDADTSLSEFARLGLLEGIVNPEASQAANEEMVFSVSARPARSRRSSPPEGGKDSLQSGRHRTRQLRARE